MEYHVYRLLKSSYFEIFGDGKYGLFSSQKVDGNMIFIDYWKLFVLNFSVMGNTVFFEPKNWWKDDIYWLLKCSWFKLFGDGKCGLFLNKKVDGKMIFTDYWKVLVLKFSVMGSTVFFLAKKLKERWYLLGFFWDFHDLQGLGKYDFSCRAFYIFISELFAEIHIFLLNQHICLLWGFSNASFMSFYILSTHSLKQTYCG